MSKGKYQYVAFKDFEPQAWTCISCYCGLCVESCPPYRVTLNEVHAARGLAQLYPPILEKRLDIKDLPDDILYSCTGCRWCEWNCSLNTPVYIVKQGNRANKVGGATLAELFRALRVETGVMPKQVKDALDNLVNYGNPYGIPKARKDKWVEELGLSLSGQDTILYVGAIVPFEDRSKAMAEAVIEILRKGDVNFGMIGGDELDSGTFARAFGEEGLFADMVEHNLKVFRENGIKRIICLSPHDYDTFVSYYEDLKGTEIKHYTQVLWDLIHTGKIKPTKELKKKVTYHDACSLGRRHSLYDDPRNVLKSIPELKFVEVVGWNKSRSFCCGGGGTGLFYDIPGLDIDLRRADQIKETGVECVAVACPICRQMLEDAMKSRDYPIEVKDIAEILREAL